MNFAKAQVDDDIFALLQDRGFKFFAHFFVQIFYPCGLDATVLHQKLYHARRDRSSVEVKAA